MTIRARPRDLCARVFAGITFLTAALVGWLALAAVAGAGLVGLALVAALVLAPGAILGVQILRMSPDRRRTLPVPASDGGCPCPGPPGTDCGNGAIRS